MNDLLTKKQFIEATLYNLQQNEPFYAALLSEINIKFSNLVPTAALIYEKKKDYFEVLVNFDYFNKITRENRVAVMWHEILHFSHNHLFRWMKFKEEGEDQLLFNIAADMAINQYIKGLPAGCPQCPTQDPKKQLQLCPNKECPGKSIDVKNFKLKDGNPFPVHQTFETYYKLLKETLSAKHKGQEKDKNGNVKKGNGQGSGQPGQNPGDKGEDGDSQGQDSKSKGKGKEKDQKGQGTNESDQYDPDQEGTNDKELDKYSSGESKIDEHMWDELSEDEKQRMLKEAEKVIKRTIEKTSNSYSTCPESIKDLLQEIEIQLTKINYKEILKSAIKKTLTLVDRASTWKRENKRYGVYSPGTKNGETPKLNIYMDTSGSISYVELSDFLKIIDGFMGVGARKCKLGLWHTALYKVINYKRHTQFNQGMIEAGGTCVAPVLEHIRKNQPDLSIILTDGYYEQLNIKVPNQVFWIISKGGNENHPLKHIGKTILLENIN